MNLSLKVASLILYVSACAAPRANTGPSSGDDLNGALVVAWNRRLVAIASAEDHLLSLKGARTLSMLHLALHDALNAVHPRYARYAYEGQARGADPIAAAAQAAYEIAAHEYPNANVELAAELVTWLAPLPEGAQKSAGLALGRAAAAEILRARQGDGWDADGDYRLLPPAPGVYAAFPEHSGTPTEFVFGSGWGRAKPFLLESAKQFRPPPPPPTDSGSYAAAFDEVKELGRFDSTTRTSDQTHAALWWKDFAESSMNRLTAQWILDKQDFWGVARFFALINASIFDSYVHAFESKFFFNHWRPYTAIRAAENDGNPSTAPDPDWDNTHHHTYPFPSYPSAHGTVCAAALTLFAKAFGDAQSFSMISPRVNEAGPMSALIDMHPPERSFSSFSEAARECALSRLYLGIHFRYDSETGNELGVKIAEYAWEHFLEPK